MRTLQSITMISVILVSSGLFAGEVRTLNDLKQQMLERGKPALLIAGADWCHYCRELAEELATSASIQPLVEQYAILKVDVESPIWPTMKQAFEFDGTGVPAVFVFRADGKQLASTNGKPRDVHAFLSEYLKQAGRVLTTEEAKSVQRDLTALTRYFKREELGLSIQILTKYEDFGESYAQPAITMSQVQDQMKQLIEKKLGQIEEELNSNPSHFESVYQFVNLQQTCKPSSELSSLIQEFEPKLSSYRVNEETLMQVTELWEADQLVENRQRGEALKQYQQIIQKYPDTMVAERAEERLGKPMKASVANSPSAATPQNGDLKKAEAYFSMGQRLFNIGSSKAEAYLQKAIDTAPGSDVAERARKLLKKP